MPGADRSRPAAGSGRELSDRAFAPALDLLVAGFAALVEGR
jgi:hypothetical protein